MKSANFHPDLCDKLGVDPNDASPLRGGQSTVAGPPSSVGSVTHTFPHAEPMAITAQVVEIQERGCGVSFWRARLTTTNPFGITHEFFLPLEAMPRGTEKGKHVAITVTPLW